MSETVVRTPNVSAETIANKVADFAEQLGRRGMTAETVRTLTFEYLRKLGVST
jgi:hypothetical protein